jgi:tetratricopeptide (TPR) repeat protein
MIRMVNFYHTFRRISDPMKIFLFTVIALLLVSCSNEEPQNHIQIEYNNKAMSFSRNGQIDSAIKYFNKSIELDSSYSTAYWNLLITYSTTKNKDSIQKGINNIHKLNNLIVDSVKYSFQLGLFYEVINKHDVAKKYYKEYYAKGKPSETDARFYFVRLLIGMNKNDVLKLYKENVDSTDLNRIEYNAVVSTISEYNRDEIVSTLTNYK